MIFVVNNNKDAAEGMFLCFYAADPNDEPNIAEPWARYSNEKLQIVQRLVGRVDEQPDVNPTNQDATVDIQARESEIHRIADLEAKLGATEADLARERDRSQKAINAKDQMQKALDGILRRSDGYYRVNKAYVR